MDEIKITALKLRPVIGTLPQEQERRQQVVADLTVRLELAEAAASDDLGATLDYAELERQAVELADGSAFKLLEALAGALADLILSFPQVVSCRVELRKPSASSYGALISVALERSRR